MNRKILAIIIVPVIIVALVAGGVFIFVRHRHAAAKKNFEILLQTPLIKGAANMDEQAREKLFENCITRDHLILLLNRIIELKTLAGAPDKDIEEARELLGQVDRCLSRRAPLEKALPGRWLVQSGVVDVHDDNLRQALLGLEGFWSNDPPVLASYIQKRLNPLKQGPPNRAKLTELERIYRQFPGQENIIYNLLRFYIALREYESYERLLRDPHVQTLLKRERNKPLIMTFRKFQGLAQAPASEKTQYRRAAFYFLHGDVDNAQAVCATGVEIYPDSAPLHFLRALALHGQGRTDFALESIQHAMDIDPVSRTYKDAREIIANRFEQKPRLRQQIILSYHRVTDEYTLETATIMPQVLEQHLIFVAEEGLPDAHPCGSESEKPPPDTPAVGFTFDDGYPDTGNIAWPLCRKYDRSAAVFMIAGRVFGDPASMDIEQLKTLKKQGLRVGLHTMNHVSVKKANAQTLDLEIGIGRWLLQRSLNAHVTCFAYPYGEFSLAAEKKLREEGFTETYTLDNAPAGNVPIRRIPIQRADSLFLFKVKLFGLGYHTWLKTIRNQIP